MVAEFWAAQPAGRVARLVGADPDAIELALEPLPEHAPAVVTCQPYPDLGTPQLVTAVLAQLDRVARTLFPAWLPGADELDGPQGARVAAVRALAAQQGARTAQFGPFLADLAERAVRGRSGGDDAAAGVRAAGLAAVIAGSYRRSGTALLVAVPAGLTPVGAQRLVAAGEWLAQSGGFAVWLAGGDLPGVDRIPSVPVRLPERVTELIRVARPPAGGPHPGGTRIGGADGSGESAGETTVLLAPGPPVAVRTFPLAGRPAPHSRAEQELEVALAQRPWAYGRAWNRTYRSHPLAEEIRVDLLWEAERCAVEIDGPEHRGALHYEADRRRDLLLQRAGFTVLRFTNRQVEQDLGIVVSHIEQLVTARRNGKD